MARIDCMNLAEIIHSRPFASSFISSVNEFRRVSDLPISGLIFEERCHRALEQIGIETDWSATAQSHKSGADILGLSLKTNKVKTLRGTPHTGLTSYRTASYSTWEAKRNFIYVQDALVRGYLFLAREEINGVQKYHLFLVEKSPVSFLNIDKYSVSEKDGNFTGIRPDGISFEIRKSTSGQLIFRNIPLTSLEQYKVLSF